MRQNGALRGEEQRFSSNNGRRGRGRGGQARHQSKSRDAQTKLDLSELVEPRGNQKKQSSRGGRGHGRGRGTPGAKSRAPVSRLQVARAVLQLLPEDIVSQSLLPFLVWHETSAVACVCKPWSVAVRHARGQHSEWKTHKFQGDNAHECVLQLARALGRGTHDGSVRFVPTFALATLAFADAQAHARYTESVWGDLVDTIVARDVLPVGCALVGLLSGDSDRGNEDQVVSSGPRDEAQVTLTISVGHFANTTVDIAAFDRKVLRWSASGLMEELECPFANGGEGERRKTSLLLWSTNAKPAQVLLSLVSQWFPGAPVGGAVLSLGDHAPPLMTFTRAAGGVSSRSKLQGRRKPKTTTVSGGGVLSCPSTLLVRLSGDVGVKPFSFCLDRPLTPILRNEELVVPTTQLDMMRQDYRVYEAVSVVDGGVAVGDANTHSLAAILRELTRSTTRAEDLVGMRLYTASSADALRVAFRVAKNEVAVVTSSAAENACGLVRPLSLYVGERGVITVSEHWQAGHYGVAAVAHTTESAASVVDFQTRQLVVSAVQASETVFGGVLSLSQEIGERRRLVYGSLRRGFNGMQCHASTVDEGVGPLTLPSGRIERGSRLLPNTTTGFLLYR